MSEHVQRTASGFVEPAYSQYDNQAGWHDTVESWSWKPLDDQTSRKCGPCPRCGHTMTVDAGAGTVANLLPSRRKRKILARCHCSANHEGHPDRPNRDWGCGFQVMIPGR